MPFNPDLRQHKIETAEYRVDGDYSHAIPAYPEYDSATDFNNAFYQERRDNNDKSVDDNNIWHICFIMIIMVHVTHMVHHGAIWFIWFIMVHMVHMVHMIHMVHHGSWFI